MLPSFNCDFVFGDFFRQDLSITSSSENRTFLPGDWDLVTGGGVGETFLLALASFLWRGSGESEDEEVHESEDPYSESESSKVQVFLRICREFLFWSPVVLIFDWVFGLGFGAGSASGFVFGFALRVDRSCNLDI